MNTRIKHNIHKGSIIILRNCEGYKSHEVQNQQAQSSAKQHGRYAIPLFKYLEYEFNHASLILTNGIL